MSPTDHEALREALGAYAIDAIDDRAELAEVERHLEICEECRLEVDRHRSVAGMLATAHSPIPDTIWGRVQEEINQTPPGRPGEVIPLRRRWNSILGVAAVTILLALVGVQSVRLEQARGDLAASEQQLAALQQAVSAGDYQTMAELASSAPGTLTVALDGEAGVANATILPDGSGYLDVHALEPLDEEHTYQLWAVLDGEVISAAVFGIDDRSVAPFKVDPNALEALVVTSEVAGGVAVSSQPAASAWMGGS